MHCCGTTDWIEKKVDPRNLFIQNNDSKINFFYPEIISLSLVQEFLDGEGGSGCSEMDHT